MTQIKQKAGIIPYYFDPKDDQLKFVFMVSSDPAFGGPKPMISKGEVEEGEELLEAAIREGEEELGLKKSNFAEAPFLLDTRTFKSHFGDFEQTTYAVEIKDKKDFGKPHYETKFCPHQTLESFLEKGRENHKDIVRKLAAKLR